jgi:hypothetical protein
VLVEALALEDVEVGDRHRGRHRVPARNRAKVVVPCRNGSNSRSEAIIAPIGEYPLVMPLAQVIMSGT